MPRSSRTVQVGDPAPSLEGVDVRGEPFSLTAQRPVPMLVEFHRGTW